MDISALTISAASKGLRDKTFSCVELTKACLGNIAKRNSELNVYVTVCEQEALVQAKACDAMFAKGAPQSPLFGIPAALKDIFCTKGVKTTACSRILGNFVPPYDATSVAKLRDAGAVFLGKTNLDEFACGASTEHSAYGPTKLPCDPTRVAGGSSGGSAAAIAADMALFSLGTDTGGSIRCPASFCGVVGLKPTYGRISRSGVVAMASSWDTVGSFGKTVRDSALVLQALAGQDPRDSTTPNVSVPNYEASLGKPIKGMRIGVPREFFEAPGMDPEVDTAVRAAVKVLEGRGAKVSAVSLPMTKYAIACYYVSMPAELSTNLARYDGMRYGVPTTKEVSSLVDFYRETRAAGFGNEIKRRIMVGTYVLSAGYYDAYYKKAQQVRTKIIEDFQRVFSEVDLLAGAVVPMPAFPIGAKQDPLAMYLVDALTIPANAAGVPAISVPCGTTKGKLPIGLQLIAPQFEEARLFSAAHAYEEATR